jgi:hypothetical protein
MRSHPPFANTEKSFAQPHHPPYHAQHTMHYLVTCFGMLQASKKVYFHHRFDTKKK